MENKLILKENPNGKQLAWGLVVGIGYFCDILIYIPYIIMSYIFGSPKNSLDANVFSTIAQLLTILLCTTVIMIVLKPKFDDIKNSFDKKTLIGNVVLMILGSIGMSYVVTILDTIIFENILHLPSTTENANQSSIMVLFKENTFVALLLVVVGAPIIEELIFRYFIFGSVARKNVVLAFILSGLTFGLVHMGLTFSEFIDSGFTDTASLINDLRQLPDYIGSGIVFSYGYYRSRSIIVPIVGHSVYNLIASITTIISLSSVNIYVDDIKTVNNGAIVTINISESYIAQGGQIDHVYVDYTVTDSDGNEQTYTIEPTDIDDNVYTFTYTFSDLSIKDENDNYIIYYVNLEHSYLDGDERITVSEGGQYFYAIQE